MTGYSQTLRTSIVVLSRQRPALLARCLAALSQQDHQHYEIILVADTASLQIRPDLSLKRIAFDRANISEGRNLGLLAAAGQVVAFIDDDALAMPDWARRITAPFANPKIIAAAGFTRGPDGLNWQVQAERIAPSGASFPIKLSDVQPWTALPVEHGCPVSTLGTNCAFRRDTLLKIGGFDPVFPYYLDESDVNMRLAAGFPQGLTAVVPKAQVIHGIAAGPIRAEAGVPLDLYDIGRSTAIFALRHKGRLPDLQQVQRRRLLRHMVAGRLDPFRVAALLKRLEAGLAAGQAGAPPEWPVPLTDRDPQPDFLPLKAGMGQASDLKTLHGWYWQRRSLRRAARQSVLEGGRVCLLLLSPTSLPHRLTLTDGGWWEQTGGLWGHLGPQPMSAAISTRKPWHRSPAQIYRSFDLAMSRRFPDFTLS